MKKYSTELYDLIKWNENPSLDQMEKLIKKGADVNFKKTATSWSMVHWAVSNNLPDFLDLLLKNGANCNENLNKYKSYPIHLIPRSTSEITCITVLKKAGADLNALDKFGLTALQHLLHPNSLASEENNNLILQANGLIENGANTNPKNKTYHPIHGAVGLKAVEIVKIMIENNPPKEDFDEALRLARALHVDVGIQYLEIVELFEKSKLY